MAFITTHTHIDLLSDSIVQNTLVSLAALVLAMVLEYMLIPHVLLISRKKQLLDTRNTPNPSSFSASRLGGISFLPVIMLSFWPVLAVQMKLLNDSTMTYGASSFSSLFFILCGGIPLLLTGIKDDLVGVHHLQKVTMKTIAAVLLVASGNYINNLYGLFGIYELPAYVGMPLTVVFVVYTLSSFHFVDRIDGLGGVLAGIAALAMGIHLILEQNCPYSIMAFAMVGMLASFLYYNFSRKKKVFMGSAGALTLGYLLVFMVIHYSMQTAHTSHESLPQPIVVAWSVLFVPLFDTLRVLCIRLYRRQPLFKADHNYIFNKLLDLGYSHKEVTVAMAACSIVIIVLNSILREQGFNITLILAINLGMSFLFCIDLFNQRPELDTEEEEAPVEIPTHIVLGPYTVATNFQLTALPPQQMVVNTINPHSWVTANNDKEFKEALLRSDTLIPDGVGIVLASSWVCRQPMRKMAGADLHQTALEYLNQTSGSVFYLGASQRTLHLLTQRLHREYPNVRVGSYSPPYRATFSDEENREMTQAVNTFAPDVLFVGMTAPKQEKWINAHRHQVNARMISGIGAVFDFYAGTTTRPPTWMIHCGLEWLGRLLKEPRRMWRRNFVSTPLYMWTVLKLKLKRNHTHTLPEYEIN